MLRTLNPFQRALLPYPDVAHDQDSEKSQHLQKAECAQLFELHSPGEEEDRLHIENYEQDRNNVEAHCVAFASVIHWINATLIRKAPVGVWFVRTDHGSKDDRAAQH